MVNLSYIRQLCKEILEIDIEHMYILEVLNETKSFNMDIKQYTIYVYAKIESKIANISLENIYPITHTVNDNAYCYNNFSEDEVQLLSEIMTLLGIKSRIISELEFKTKLELIGQAKVQIVKKLMELDEEILSLKERNKSEEAFNMLLERNALIQDVEKLKIQI